MGFGAIAFDRAGSIETRIEPPKIAHELDPFIGSGSGSKKVLMANERR
jgi:hypothetical protein